MIEVAIAALVFASVPSTCDESAFVATQKVEREQVLASMGKHVAHIEELLAQRNAIRQRLVELDAMSPSQRAIKKTFNADYDPRVLRGRDERIGLQVDGLRQSITMLDLKNDLLDAKVKEFAVRCESKVQNAQD